MHENLAPDSTVPTFASIFTFARWRYSILLCCIGDSVVDFRQIWRQINGMIPSTCTISPILFITIAQVTENKVKKVYLRRHEKPPLAVRCCHVVNDLTIITDKRTDKQDEQANRRTSWGLNNREFTV